MEIIVSRKFAKIAPRKARLVASQAKGKSVSTIIDTFGFVPKKGARFLIDLCKQAKAIAESRGIDVPLNIKLVKVDQGPALKRRRIGSRGRTTMYKRIMSHITIVVTDTKPEKTRIKKIEKREAPKDKKPAKTEMAKINKTSVSKKEKKEEDGSKN